MILIIDNYDSFSYNLVQLIGEILEEHHSNEMLQVIRNDEMTIDEIKDLTPTHIILSPGPGKPCDAGICEEVIQVLKGVVPILGVCLGHQAICEVFGAKITYAAELMHGKQSLISIVTEDLIFKGLQTPFAAARYHSLVADRDTIPNDLIVLAKSQDGEIMAVKHKKYEIYGLQFHPESILTLEGKRIVDNFIFSMAKKSQAGRLL